MSRMKWWHWALIAFFVLCGSGVLIGVLLHKEPGLMEVCWGSGKAEICKGGEPLKWDRSKIPLKVEINLEGYEKVYKESVEAAVKMWNREIGKVFEIVKSEGNVTVGWGVKPSQGNVGGWTEHYGKADSDGKWKAEKADVTLVEAGSVNFVHYMAAHELGHVLGLAHDGFQKSVMYPATGEEKDLKLALPSDYDKKLLRKELLGK